jgi:hypothetical protein
MAFTGASIRRKGGTLPQQSESTAAAGAVPSGMRLEFGGGLSGNMRLSFQAAALLRAAILAAVRKAGPGGLRDDEFGRNAQDALVLQQRIASVVRSGCSMRRPRVSPKSMRSKAYLGYLATEPGQTRGADGASPTPIWKSLVQTEQQRKEQSKKEAEDFYAVRLQRYLQSHGNAGSVVVPFSGGIIDWGRL